MSESVSKRKDPFFPVSATDPFGKGFAKGRRKALKTFLKTFGASSVEELKKEYDEIVSVRDELKKQFDLLKLEREAEREKNRAELNRLKVLRSLERAAVKEGIIAPENLEMLSLKGLTIDDEGAVHGVEETLSSLRRERPYLFHDAPDVSLLDNTRPNGRSSADLESMGYEERVELYRRSPARYKKLTNN